MPTQPSPLALTVLFMLIGGPMHPYEMQRRLRQWQKDQVVNVERRGNLYKTFDRLARDGLIAVRATERDKGFPERTVYELTPDGLRVGREWLKEMLSTRYNEFPRFPAALSFMFGLLPEEALLVLEQRAIQLQGELARLDRDLAAVADRPPPMVTLLDTQYLRHLTASELEFVRGIVANLRSGALTWSEKDFADSDSHLPD